MLQLDNVEPENMSEVVRLAAEMYARDQNNDLEIQRREEQIRKATKSNRLEEYLLAEYLERAAIELQNRRSEELQQRYEQLEQVETQRQRARNAAAFFAFLALLISGIVVFAALFFSSQVPQRVQLQKLPAYHAQEASFGADRSLHASASLETGKAR